jgi:SAM-dependent methyltransferase
LENMLKFIYMHDVLLFILLIFVFSIAIAGLSLAPWVPTRKKDLQRICELADFKKGDIFYDLGSGDGRLVIYANQYYDVKSVGIEIALPFYFFTKARRWLNKSRNIKFKFKNIFSENLSAADVIYVFPQSAEKLTGKIIAKFNNELKSGAKIITYAFPIRQWVAQKIDKPTVNDLPIYLYIINKVNPPPLYLPIGRL